MSQNLKHWIESSDHDKGKILDMYVKIIIEVNDYHLNGKVFGNLSPDSIIVLDENNLQFNIDQDSEVTAYTAPELFDSNNKTKTEDVYSMGIILYEMLSGMNYWDYKEMDIEGFKEFIKDSRMGIDEQEIDSFSEFSDIMLKTTMINPEGRIQSIDDIIDLIRDAFPDIEIPKAEENEQVFNINEDDEQDNNQTMEEELEDSNETMEEELEDADLTPIEGREIGIDLGTTNSVVSYYKDERIKILRIKNSETTPSAIFFDSSNRILFGKNAISRGLEYPESVAKLFKRKLKDNKDKIRIEFHEKDVENNETIAEGKVYIIDTNAFIDEPFILKKISDNDTAIVSLTVLEELGYRKKDGNTEYQAQEAIDSINELKYKLRFEESDESLLPEDLFKNTNSNNDNNDNKILSIAIKIKKENPIIITSDKGLQTKASIVKVNYLTLKEFLLNEIIIPDKSNLIQISGEEASALFLGYLKEEAQKELGPVTKALITVPANFNTVEIEATKRAGEEAGFEEVEINKEPTAAAIAYGFELEESKKILVYDFGGGTFDVSIIEAEPDKTFKVLNAGGDSNLGGEDLTYEIIEYIYEKLENEFDIDMSSKEDSTLSTDEYAYNKKTIYREAEIAKIQLSDVEETEIPLVNIFVKSGEQKSHAVNISRKDFENLVRDKINKTQTVLDNTIKGAGLYAEDIDIIILAGGTSLMPIIQEKVRKYFGKAPNYERNAATVIAQGAAIIANALWDKSDNGIQEELLTIDSTINDFGVSIKGRIFDCLIPENTPLPHKVEKKYTNVRDEQDRLEISVYSRDKMYPNSRRTIDDGINLIDRIIITNLPPMKLYEASITVTFELSKDDILNVDAKVYDINGKLITSKAMKVQKSSRQR